MGLEQSCFLRAVRIFEESVRLFVAHLKSRLLRKFQTRKCNGPQKPRTTRASHIKVSMSDRRSLFHTVKGLAEPIGLLQLQTTQLLRVPASTTFLLAGIRGNGRPQAYEPNIHEGSFWWIAFLGVKQHGQAKFVSTSSGRFWGHSGSTVCQKQEVQLLPSQVESAHKGHDSLNSLVARPTAKMNT